MSTPTYAEDWVKAAFAAVFYCLIVWGTFTLLGWSDDGYINHHLTQFILSLGIAYLVGHVGGQRWERSEHR